MNGQFVGRATYPAGMGAPPQPLEACMVVPAPDFDGAHLRISPGPEGVLSLAGELDLASAPGLRTAIQQKLDTGAQRLVLDLTDLSFCDSAGLSVMAWAEQHFPAGVLLHQPRPQLRKILRTTQLEQALAID
jgi:anti-sigma B factor antagonist